MSIFRLNPNSTNLIQNNSQAKYHTVVSTNFGKQQHKTCLWNLISHYIDELIVCKSKTSLAVNGPNRNPNTIENEADCIKVWTEEISCQCQFEPNTGGRLHTIRNNRNLMKRREMRKNLFVEKDETAAKTETVNLWDPRENDENSFEPIDQADDYWSCSSGNESDDELFWTPPQSPVHFVDADSKMHLDFESIEEYDVFIEG
jgi:hypothetical protein